MTEPHGNVEHARLLVHSYEKFARHWCWIRWMLLAVWIAYFAVNVGGYLWLQRKIDASYGDGLILPLPNSAVVTGQDLKPIVEHRTFLARIENRYFVLTVCHTALATTVITILLCRWRRGRDLLFEADRLRRLYHLTDDETGREVALDARTTGALRPPVSRSSRC